ncbi:hypothetical protein BO94DRAFT_468609 [Aspergillus sclerotioniger CBS 115572]|uniref:DUF7702 domain-containing protein n=1 Tax=Aspergillus sclerotioniger CBS 115572 TaxID=1450535 RepID=A0A317WCB4_9EURO|nr:hypothetical protein BO94DRAFT_468609 [Aspergillus sclerotioniger CBS 115572]PWY83869.1 hypothetical protein BO94DRAFT_468609 [Aspergillus sclerotioniger CBS 115572]
MTLTYRDGISIAQIIIYFPALIFGYFLIWRHGIRQSLEFCYLVIFATLRIIGACCMLAAIHDASTSLYVTIGICSAIGLSPLISLCNSFLSRANTVIQINGGKSLHRACFHALHILTIIALIITILGLTSHMSLSIFEHPSSKIKIGTILFVVAWFVLCTLLGILYWKRSAIEKGERRTLLAVGLSLPFLAVRLLYSVLMWFLPSSTFNFMDGNPTVELVMSVLEELAVVIMCTGVGVVLRVRDFRGERDGDTRSTSSHRIPLNAVGM